MREANLHSCTMCRIFLVYTLVKLEIVVWHGPVIYIYRYNNIIIYITGQCHTIISNLVINAHNFVPILRCQRHCMMAALYTVCSEPTMHCIPLVFAMMLLKYKLILLPSHFNFCECTDIMLVVTKRHKQSAW